MLHRVSKYISHNFTNRQLLKNVIKRAAATYQVNFKDPIHNVPDFHKIENQWKDKVISSKYDETDTTKPKYYVLSMFPYPSGSLHMGHIRVYTISDAIAHLYRMNGYNVLHPMGWDAFGLPAENAAIDKNIDPAKWTYENINSMKEQFKSMNYCFDWDREFSTCDPEYYRWTQELFLKLYDKGLAYQKEEYVNWDPVDQTVLAEEQISAGNTSWRSGAKVEKKLLKQWFIRTSPFAKDMYEGLNSPAMEQWRDIVKIQQHWIGECTGMSFDLQLISDIEGYPKTINVWTETPAFIEYAKFIAVSPQSLLSKNEYCKVISPSIKALNATALNPYNGEELPVFVTDKIEYPPWRDVHLGIPAASMTDFQFGEVVGIPYTRHSIKTYEQHYAKLEEVTEKAREWKIGGYSVSPRHKDWLISRQRYWGTPIPIIHCESCGVQPVPREQLPVVLPKIDNTKPANKKSALRDNSDWLHTTCPKCGGHATREPDTMDTFVDSSWYFARFTDPKNTSEMFSPDKLKGLYPVDLYIGGKEHAALHLYYARFLSHFLYSEGLVPTKEPFDKLLVQGIIMGQTYQAAGTGKYLRKDEVENKDGKIVEKASGEPVTVSWEKMSKSKFNGVDPHELISTYGIDATRMLILADVAPTSERKWSTETIVGIKNWQARLWKNLSVFSALREGVSLDELTEGCNDPKYQKDDEYAFDCRNYFLCTVNYNLFKTQQLSVAISRMQGLTNGLSKVDRLCKLKSVQYERALAVQIIMLAPVAPHFASEMWAKFCEVKHHLMDRNEAKMDKDVLEQDWPKIDMEYNLSLNVNVDGHAIVNLKIPKKDLITMTADVAMEKAQTKSKFTQCLKHRTVQDANLLLEGD